MNPTETAQPTDDEASETEKTKSNRFSRYFSLQWSKIKRRPTPSLGRMCSCSVGRKSKIPSNSNLYTPLPVENKISTDGTDGLRRSTSESIRNTVQAGCQDEATEKLKFDISSNLQRGNEEVRNAEDTVDAESRIVLENETDSDFSSGVNGVCEVGLEELEKVDSKLTNNQNDENIFIEDSTLVVLDEKELSYENVTNALQTLTSDSLLEIPSDDTPNDMKLEQFVESLVSKIVHDAQTQEVFQETDRDVLESIDTVETSAVDRETTLVDDLFPTISTSTAPMEFQTEYSAVFENVNKCLFSISSEVKEINENTPIQKKSLEAETTTEVDNQSVTVSPKCGRYKSLTSFHLCFSQPGRKSSFIRTVMENCVLLEDAQIDMVRGVLTGIIRVRSFGFEKMITIRITFDNWMSFCEVPTQYVQDSHDGVTDKFSFRIVFPSTLLPGDYVHFAIRYQTHTGETFWDNNKCENYSVSCYSHETEVSAD